MRFEDQNQWTDFLNVLNSWVVSTRERREFENLNQIQRRKIYFKKDCMSSTNFRADFRGEIFREIFRNC